MTTLTRALAGTALVGALATSAIANECTKFSGFYLGAQVGVGTTNTKTSGTLVAGGAALPISARLAATGVIGGLHVGYGKQFPNHFYVGLEAYGNLSGNKETHNVDSASLKAERSNSFGLKLRPGYAIGNVLPYLLVGIESAGFKYGFTVDTPATANKKSRRTGVPVGVGVAFHATDHIILGVEGTQTFYNSRKVSIANTTNSVSFKSQATDVVVRASYKW